MEAEKLPAEEAGDRAIELCQKYLGIYRAGRGKARTMLAQEYPRQRAALSASSFAKFAQSQDSILVVDEILRAADLSSIATRDELIWSGYRVPEDCAGWVHAFVAAAEDHSACI
eukprot:3860278-Prymnesium_polylepis.1